MNNKSNEHGVFTVSQTVVTEMHKCRAQWAQWAGGAPRPAPALGPRATLSALAHAHKRAVSYVSIPPYLLDSCLAIFFMIFKVKDPLRSVIYFTFGLKNMEDSIQV